MAYIGNTPAEAYTSIDKQDITGNGGASYTLNHAVANENEIEVFVNNVRQEPSVAYTVSGTALTMTGNVEASDDFYVVFQGKAIQTISHPEGQDLKARDGTFSGVITAPKFRTTDDGIETKAATDVSMSSTGDGQLKIDGNGYTGAIALDGSNMNIYTNSSSRGIVLGTNETERLKINGNGTWGKLPPDTGVIQWNSSTSTGVASWSTTGGTWYNTAASTTITPTAAGNIIMVVVDMIVPAETSNVGNNNKYRAQYGSNTQVQASDSWNYSSPSTHVNFCISRTGISLFTVAAGEVGVSQTVRGQWSPDGTGTYKAGGYQTGAHHNSVITVMEIRG